MQTIMYYRRFRSKTVGIIHRVGQSGRDCEAYTASFSQWRIDNIAFLAPKTRKTPNCRGLGVWCPVSHLCQAKSKVVRYSCFRQDNFDYSTITNFVNTLLLQRKQNISTKEFLNIVIMSFHKKHLLPISSIFINLIFGIFLANTESKT